jgi:hypothetical protein
MPARPHQALLINALTLGAALVALGAFASTASADGLPVLGMDVGGQGVTVPASPVRYVTLRTGQETVVARTAADGGRVLRFTQIRGNFTIPAVAYDGSSSGLAADGSTLALIEPRLSFPRARTAFVVLDAKRLRLRKAINLRGDFSFDAISRDGRTLFFIEYVSPRDPTRYNVRAYDVLSGRLLAKPVVDPHEGQDAMRGSPLTRTTSPDGRWAYTLYDGAGNTPFVHALDTSKREARCIDLPMLAGRLGVGPLTADGHAERGEAHGQHAGTDARAHRHLELPSEQAGRTQSQAGATRQPPRSTFAGLWRSGASDDPRSFVTLCRPQTPAEAANKPNDGFEPGPGRCGAGRVRRTSKRCARSRLPRSHPRGSRRSADDEAATTAPDERSASPA